MAVERKNGEEQKRQGKWEKNSDVGKIKTDHDGRLLRLYFFCSIWPWAHFGLLF